MSDEPLHLAEAGYRASANHPDLNWKFRVLTAEALVRKGMFAQALDLLKSDPPSNVSPEVSWRRMLTQASSLCLLGNYLHAEQLLSQAESVAKESADRRTELSYVRGRCAMIRQEWKKAEGYLLPIAKPAAASDQFLRAYVLASLGWSARQERNYEEAIDWYSQDLLVVQSLKAPFLEQQASGNLGFLYAELGEFATAKKNSEDAERIASQWNFLRDEQKWLIDIGYIQRVQGQSGYAEDSYKRALAIATRFADKDTAANILHNLTSLKLSQGQKELAEQYHREEFNLGLKGNNLRYWQLDEAEILAANVQYSKAITDLLNLLHQSGSDDENGEAMGYRLQWIIQSELARTYALLGNARDAELWFKRSIITVERAATKMKREEFRTAIRDNIAVFDGYVSFLADQNQPAKALQVAQSGRGRTLMPRQQGHPRDTAVWLGKIQDYLRRDSTVLLSYFATEKECYLWAVTSNQVHLLRLGISRPDLDALIDSYKQEIQQHLSLEASPAAKKLFQVLIQPASNLTPRGKHVVIVADSQIYSLNFETLINPSGGDHYWIEDVELENASSIDLLIDAGKKRAPARGLLLLGAPAPADPNFVELPHAPDEMRSVRSHFSSGEVKSFSGKEATPDSYLNSSPGSYRFIHLATHGTPNAIEPLQSAIILSSDTNGKFKLLAEDIVKVPLNADLVTISACQGVGTNIQSLEGLLGLEWAFMRAGAHQVVAALWDVDDTITPPLMNDFYGQLKQGKTAADALRHAKLDMLHAGGFHTAPYYWAALQLYTRS